MRRTTQPAWPGDDFPSWLSPMVVKELRQGVQSGTFAWTFIALQVAMFLFLSFAVLMLDELALGAGPNGLDFAFWPMVGLAVLFILPLRGLGAISGEKMGNNLDLVRLTQLSATKIVLGKWLAIVAQGALLVTAILPYVVLRYFFGDVNVIRDLTVIGWLFAGSMVVAAAAIALSTKSPQVRIASLVLILPSLVSGIELLDNPGGRGWMGGSSWLGLLAVMALYAFALLEYSASTIAPVAENHAMRKRSIALVIGVVWILAAVFTDPRVTWLMTLPLVLVYAIEAVLEQPVHLRSQAAAFARFGSLGRLAARVLTPGWTTGLVFVLVVLALCLLSWGCWLVRSPSIDGGQVFALVAFGMLLVAAVLFPLPVFVYFPRLPYRFLIYVLIQLVCYLVFLYANVVGLREEAWLLLLPLPLASLSALVSSGGGGDAAFAASLSGLLVTVAVCFAVFRPWLREMKALSRTMSEVQASRALQIDADNAGATA